MSRWDALKPDSDHKKRSYHLRKSGKPSEQEKLCCKNNGENSSALLRRYNSLRESYVSHARTDLIDDLVRSIDSALKYISAEDLAHDTVQAILLPHITSEASTTAFSRRQILRTLNNILSSQQHASSLIAPLVEEVRLDGSERTRANPTRYLLFAALQEQLYRIPDTAPKTLITALTVAYQIEQTRRHASSSSFDVDPVVVRSFLQRQLESSNNPGDAIKLATALFRRHPECTASFAMPLLEGIQKASACKNCGFAGSSSFMNLLHSPSNDPVLASAFDCAAELVKNLPLSLWMRQNQKDSVRTTLHFRDRVVSCLVNLNRISNCRIFELANGDKVLLCSVLSLVKVLLCKIPYHQEDSALTTTAHNLVHSLSSWIVNRSERRNFEVVADRFADLCGGQITPQGQLSPMSFPLRQWLDTEQGILFTEHMLTEIEKSPSDTKIVNLVCAILRSHPGLLLSHQGVWSIFQITMTRLLSISDPAPTLAAMRVIEGVLRGRQDHLIYHEGGADASLATFVTPHLFSILKSSNASCCVAAYGAYSCLSHSDFIALEEEGQCMIHIRAILTTCRTRADVKLHAYSLKCIGEICSQYFCKASFPQERMLAVCGEVTPILLDGLRDSEASVRSMSLFAIGNLTQAIRNAGISSSMIPYATLVEIASRVGDCASDADEKVVNNAIRAASHVVSLLLSHNDMASATDEDLSASHIRDVLAILSNRVLAVLSLAQPRVQASLSWKQRSAVKKHAWGACNALRTIFSAGILEHDEFVGACQVPAESLITCVEHSLSLNDKVVCCASSALRCVDSMMLMSLVDSTARCIVACITCLFDPDAPSSEKLKCELELLLLHLLKQPSIQDILTVLRSGLLSSQLDKLYKWMVSKSCPSFGVFALAMQTGAVVDVEIEQCFASRALDITEIGLDDEL